MKTKCLRTDYTEAPDDQLDLKAAAVKKGLTDNAVDFPSPPVSPATFATLILNFTNTRSAYKLGGIDQKPNYDAAKLALLNGMNDTADYVDEIANGDSSLIIKGGFVPTKTVASPVPAPAQPVDVEVKREAGIGNIAIECPAIDGAEFYGLIVSEGAPLNNFLFLNGQLRFEPMQPNSFGIDVNKSRKKKVLNLTPGTMYYFYMYAGNANGISPLSVVTELRAA